METEGNKYTADELNRIALSLFMGDSDYNFHPMISKRFPPKFDSWNEIMPVWIKFRDLHLASDDEWMDHHGYTQHLKDLLYVADSPSDFFPHLVEAVKWYQSTKK